MAKYGIRAEKFEQDAGDSDCSGTSGRAAGNGGNQLYQGFDKIKRCVAFFLAANLQRQVIP